MTFKTFVVYPNLLSFLPSPSFRVLLPIMEAVPRLPLVLCFAVLIFVCSPTPPFSISSFHGNSTRRLANDEEGPAAGSTEHLDSVFLWQSKLAKSGASVEVLLKHGGSLLALSTIRHFPHNPDVLSAGLTVLATLAYRDDDSRRKELAAAGAEEVVVEAMRDFPFSKNLQSLALWTLLGLAKDKSSPRPNGAAGLVVAAMRTFSGDAVEIIRPGLEAIGALVSEGDNMGVLVEAVSAAMLRFPEDVEVQSRALNAMESLVSIDESNRERLVDEGAVEPVLAFLNHTFYGETVLLTATRVFPYLVTMTLPKLLSIAQYNKEIRKLDAMEGTIDLLIQTIKKHPSDCDLQSTAYDLVANLASIGENASRLRAMGACELLVNSIRTFHNQHSFWIHALNAINSLSTNKDNWTRLHEAGICQWLRFFPPVYQNGVGMESRKKFQEALAIHGC